MGKLKCIGWRLGRFHLTILNKKSTYIYVHVIMTEMLMNMSIQVEFMGEQGIDTGGLTRECFRLVGTTFSLCI